MVDMTKTIEPKSDQLNADDLIGKTLTIKITGVKGYNDLAQPVGINYEGDNGKPYKPCKSMRRVFVNAWGSDAKKYVGRSITLYRDDSVKFGGIEVGGIRISHMSDIDKPVTMALTASRASRKPFTVQPLKIEVDEELEKLKVELKKYASKGTVHYESYLSKLTESQKDKLKKGVVGGFWTECKKICSEFDNKKEQEQDIEINKEEKEKEDVE